MTPTGFDDLAETLELQGKIAAAFRDLNARDQEAAQDLLARLTGIVGAGRNGTGRKPVQPVVVRRDESESYRKVAAMFVQTGNHPLTKAEIVEKCGISEGGLHTLIYSTRPDAFHKFSKPGVRGKVFILTPEALEEAEAVYRE